MHLLRSSARSIEGNMQFLTKLPILALVVFAFHERRAWLISGYALGHQLVLFHACYFVHLGFPPYLWCETRSSSQRWQLLGITSLASYLQSEKF